jgi:hypothetical protein
MYLWIKNILKNNHYKIAIAIVLLKIFKRVIKIIFKIFLFENILK